ncbi:hypothetical protein AAMO2058_001682400 [Amorphochlora amoebiformis]
MRLPLVAVTAGTLHKPSFPFPQPMLPREPTRVIAHLDMDCFYCQVEHERLKIPMTTPLAVQQWSGLIAINYAARKFGVKRGMTIADAKKACKDLVCVHVELIGEGGKPVKDEKYASRSQAKVTLRRYRRASAKVMAIFSRIAGRENMQRTSIDEAYIDLTGIVKDRQEAKDYEVPSVKEVLNFTRVFGAEPEEIPTDFLEAARVVDGIRRAVRKELNFSVSAGIAVNKIIAKVASSKNKPDMQTVIPPDRTKSMIHALNVHDIPGLGGKLGRRVEDWIRRRKGFQEAGRAGGKRRWVSKSKTPEPEPVFVRDLDGVTLNDLQPDFSIKTAKFLLDIANGIDNDPVVERNKPKSLLAFKSFEPIRELKALEKWLELLSAELEERIEEDKLVFHRQPTRISLYHRPGRPPNSKPWDQMVKTISRSGPFTGSTRAEIYHHALGLLSHVEPPLPCTRIAIGVEVFRPLPKTGCGAINSFFKPSQRNLPQTQPTQTLPNPRSSPHPSPASISSVSVTAGGKGFPQSSSGRKDNVENSKRGNVVIRGRKRKGGGESEGDRKRPRTSHEDPNFIKGFFRASRLHFIGSWKETYERILDELPPPPPIPNPPPLKRRILHVDMDCFFAAVAVRDRPHLKGKPVVVCWSTNDPRGREPSSSEISSATYEARKFGIRAGMRLGKARELCPSVIAAPYEFHKYTKAAEDLYSCVFSLTPHVQGVSCDECYLDVSNLIMDLDDDTNTDTRVDSLAENLRKNIHSKTGCTASVGCGHNRLMARIATKRAKPNGYFRISPNKAEPFLAPLPVSELPGVGYRTSKKLKGLGVITCSDITKKSMTHWQSILGKKLGQAIHEHAKGIDLRIWDARPLRKSVGAQLSWGVRFEEGEEVLVFLRKLSNEVSTRMKRYGVRGRNVSLKLWRAVKNAPNNMRKGFVGHGVCDILNRSLALPDFTHDPNLIAQKVLSMWEGLRVHAKEVRGLGVQVSSLDSDPNSRKVKSFPPKLGKKTKKIAPAGKQTIFDPKSLPPWYSSYIDLPNKKKPPSPANFFKRRPVDTQKIHPPELSEKSPIKATGGSEEKVECNGRGQGEREGWGDDCTLLETEIKDFERMGRSEEEVRDVISGEMRAAMLLPYASRVQFGQVRRIGRFLFFCLKRIIHCNHLRKKGEVKRKCVELLQFASKAASPWQQLPKEQKAGTPVREWNQLCQEMEEFITLKFTDSSGPSSMRSL